MAPIKSSLARSGGKLFGVFKDTDLSLRGATQNQKYPEGVLGAFTCSIWWNTYQVVDI